MRDFKAQGAILEKRVYFLLRAQGYRDGGTYLLFWDIRRELFLRDFKAQFSEAAMRIPKGDALRPSELFEHLEALKKSS